jgi:hypothetical protein
MNTDVDLMHQNGLFEMAAFTFFVGGEEAKSIPYYFFSLSLAKITKPLSPLSAGAAAKKCTSVLDSVSFESLLLS